MLTLVYVFAVMGSLVAVIAQAKGRSPGLWLVYGVLLWPVALVHILRKNSGKLEPARSVMPLRARSAWNWHQHAPGR